MRRKHQDRIHALLMHWGHSKAQQQSEALGYPAKTVLGRLADGEIQFDGSHQKSKILAGFSPPDLVRIDRIMTDDGLLPADVRAALLAKYVPPEGDVPWDRKSQYASFRAVTGQSMGSWEAKVKSGLLAVHVALGVMQRKEDGA